MARGQASRAVNFELVDPSVNEVILQGNFLKWKTSGIRMAKDEKGSWRTKVWLKPGQYQYKFVADGIWICDPANPAKADEDRKSVV
jgi:1,4-alpha-glucan branching enzyme